MTIKEMREKTDFTQKALAEYIGTNIRNIQHWEQHNACPPYIERLIEYRLRGEGLIE